MRKVCPLKARGVANSRIRTDVIFSSSTDDQNWIEDVLTNSRASRMEKATTATPPLL